MATKTKQVRVEDLDIPRVCICGHEVDDGYMAQGEMLAHWRKAGALVLDPDKGFTLNRGHEHFQSEDYIDPALVTGIIRGSGPGVKPLRTVAMGITDLSASPFVFPALPVISGLSLPMPKWLLLTLAGHVVTLSATAWPGLLSEPIQHWASILNTGWQYPEVSVPVVVSFILSFLMKDVRDKIASIVAWVLIVTVMILCATMIYSFWLWSHGS